MSNFDEQMHKTKTQRGFIAALDQSGGSTPQALALYGIKDHVWKDDNEMLTSCIECAPGSSPVPASTMIALSVPSF
jgi:fructose-bisphosphate aldolase class 1